MSLITDYQKTAQEADYETQKRRELESRVRLLGEEVKALKQAALFAWVVTVCSFMVIFALILKT